MSYLQSISSRFNIWFLILTFLALHAIILPYPQEEVFDENYYTKAAVDLINGVASNAEHPFVGKLWGALGILILGNNWLGWRLHTVIFGALTLLIFYRLARLFLDEKRALYASTLLAFDNIFFIHSGLFLLEVPALFFSTSMIYLYLKKRHKLAAASAALAFLSKETSLFFILALTIYHLAVYVGEALKSFSFIKKSLKPLLIFLTISILVAGIPIWIYDITYQPSRGVQVVKSFVVEVDEKGSTIGTTVKESTQPAEAIRDPVSHLIYIFTYASSLTLEDSETIDLFNYPWNWILPLPPREMVYYSVAVRENITEQYEDKVIYRERVKHPIHYAGIGNLPLWLIGFWLTASASTYLLFKKKSEKSLELLIAAWILGTYGPYLAMSYFIKRIVYTFYFINTVPALALGLAYYPRRIFGEDAGRFSEAVALGSALMWFILYFPVRVLEF